MTRIVAFYLLGALLGLWLPITALIVVIGIALLAVVKSSRRPQRLVCALAVAAAALGALRANQTIESELQQRVAQRIDLRGEVTVSGLPRRNTENLTFVARSDDGRRLRLTWTSPESLRSGDRLAVSARLRPIRGVANPGGFDFERWALAAQIHGTGYIREARRLDPEHLWIHRLHHLRQALSERINTSVAGVAGRLLPALIVGDRQWLTAHDQEVLAATGIAHLLSISGLHIALVAGIGALIGRLLWPCVMRWIPRGQIVALPAIAAACIYAGLAGFSLATQRALVMLAVWWLLLAFSRPVRPAGTLMWAALAVLLLDPLAPLSAGFWLSFGAVACLVVVSAGRASAGSRVALAWRAQTAILCGMAPIVAALGLPQTLWALPINLVAIPLVSVVVMPLALGGAAALPLFPGIGDPLLWAAAVTLDGLWRALDPISGAELRRLGQLPAAGWPVLVGALLWLMPVGCGLRLPACALIVGGFFGPSTRLAEGEFEVHVLDVGQGLAVGIETRQRFLLYDTGPRSRGGWSAGRTIVAPWLRAEGRMTLDRLIVSHGDSDHAGGLAGLRAGAIEFDSLIAVGVPAPDVAIEPCRRGQRWTWDGVTFAVLHPGPGLPYLGNDSSCVLVVESDSGRAVLPGDIGAVVERRLRAEIGPADLLVAAHHGSRSSTSADWLDALDPAWVAFSTGHGNRFQMPHPEVLARVAGRRVVDTAACGYVRFVFSESGTSVASERSRRRQRWHPQDAPDKNRYDCAL